MIVMIIQADVVVAKIEFLSLLWVLLLMVMMMFLSQSVSFQADLLGFEEKAYFFVVVLFLVCFLR